MTLFYPFTIPVLIQVTPNAPPSNFELITFKTSFLSGSREPNKLQQVSA